MHGSELANVLIRIRFAVALGSGAGQFGVYLGNQCVTGVVVHKITFAFNSCDKSLVKHPVAYIKFVYYHPALFYAPVGGAG